MLNFFFFYHTLSEGLSFTVCDIIDLIMVFNPILTSRQSGEKLECLYGHPMANIFLQNWILHSFRPLIFYTKHMFANTITKAFQGSMHSQEIQSLRIHDIPNVQGFANMVFQTSLVDQPFGSFPMWERRNGLASFLMLNYLEAKIFWY